MYRRWGVGSYRGGQSLGSTAARQGAAYPNSDPDGYTNGNGYVHTNSYGDTYANGNADRNSHRDTNSYGYIHANPNGYVYADANSVTRALCTRCQCGH
jgi:hypothetical protein